jgi:DNA-binding GntR family transcriptional regulator
MNNLPPTAIEHFVPVLEIFLALLAMLFALIVGLWRGFRWLDEEIGKRINGWSESEAFKHAVAQIVTQAFAPITDINNRLHEEHRRGLAEMRKRDDERAEAIKRLHGRVDDVWKEVSK